MAVKDIIKQRRTELGLTLLDIAKQVGVSEGTVSRWESGDISNMRRDKIVALSNALKISPAVIMEWDEDTALAELPASNNFPGTDPLWAKITQLDDADRGKVEAYTDGLLAADKYQSFTKIKNA